jgi:predicted small lipoprotein YifL
MKTTTSAIILLILFLAGCGQSGPLYIPGDPSSIEPAEQPADAEDDSDDDAEDADRP